MQVSASPGCGSRRTAGSCARSRPRRFRFHRPPRASAARAATRRQRARQADHGGSRTVGCRARARRRTTRSDAPRSVTSIGLSEDDLGLDSRVRHHAGQHLEVVALRCRFSWPRIGIVGMMYPPPSRPSACTHWPRQSTRAIGARSRRIDVDLDHAAGRARRAGEVEASSSTATSSPWRYGPVSCSQSGSPGAGVAAQDRPRTPPAARRDGGSDESTTVRAYSSGGRPPARSDGSQGERSRDAERATAVPPGRDAA